MINYNKPTAQMLGRYQPFHDGHLELFKKILEKTGQVIIMVRSCTGDNNPYPFKTVKRKIIKKLRNYTNHLMFQSVEWNQKQVSI